MSWQERRCNAEGFGRPEPFFFLCEERTYSPPAKQAVVSLLRRAVRSARRMRLLREPTANAAETAVLVIIVCAEWISAPIHSACENLHPAALSQRQAFPKVWSAFSFAKEKQKKKIRR